MATKKQATKKRATRQKKIPARASSGVGLTAISIGVTAIAAGAVVIGYIATRMRDKNAAEHPAPDLVLEPSDRGADDRAPDAFRPDPTASVPAGEREALRPATLPVR